MIDCSKEIIIEYLTNKITGMGYYVNMINGFIFISDRIGSASFAFIAIDNDCNVAYHWRESHSTRGEFNFNINAAIDYTTKFHM